MKSAHIALLASLVATSSALAHDSLKIKALETRLQELEERVSRLETTTAPSATKADAEQRVGEQQTNARERMRKDSAVYSREQLREIEGLYQVANKNWRTPAGKDSLKKLVETYDKANRTGCALLYLGQMSDGTERENYLRKAIQDFSDCYYGNGVQVGAYARFYLAHHYKENGEAQKANVLFEEIKSMYPNAIDHKGRFLADLMAE